ncbi:hypothetical protein [Hymenobacter wooponensis]|uniref:Uncharacterized protein n=1 Tax=Hymenobacter wooponensis TaxID=1525360 RepID=A0A4Z0MLJ3_9BACT|nr:hypothetical protein [Hymenobacter wooponensis]TGD80299.1 hypothetical protein EU557_10670 [Hymenobacter wooponensis]
MDVYTQPLVIQLQPYCPGSGVYLRWLSPLGNWEGWLFEGDIDDSTPAPTGNTFQPARGAALKLRSTTSTRRLLRAGNLTPRQHAVLSTLQDSPQVYMQDAGGALMPVTVVPATTGRTSAESRTEFDVEIDLGPRNTLTRI